MLRAKVELGPSEVSVTVQDDRHPGMCGVFTWTRIAPFEVDDWLSSIELRAVDPGQQVTLTAIRQLPMKTWQRHAEVERDRAYMHEASEQQLKEIRDPASGVVDAVRWGGPWGGRYQVSERLKEVSEMYAQLVAEGDPSPAKRISERYGASVNTVQQWLHKARWAGLVPKPTSSARSKDQTG